MRFSSRSLLILFWACFAVGYFYMLLAVNFNPIEMVSYFMAPRFSAPWSRGRYGDARALLVELGATIYLVPPIAGLILARRHLFSRFAGWTVIGALLFTLFYGVTSGTRSVTAAFLITFLVTYYYACRSRREFFVIAAFAAALMLASTIYGLAFRNVGLSAYLGGDAPREVGPQMFVDFNLLAIAQLVALFPDHVPYLGLEVPFWILVRIVPRALWPGKPDGVSVSPETYIAPTGDLTISSTYIGEAYMCAGILAAIIASLFLGWLAAWWARKAFSVRSDFAILLYGSGFFAAVITMRSLYVLPVAILPVFAVAFLGRALGGEGRR